MVICDAVFEKLVQIASTKIWPAKKLKPEDIVEIMLSNPNNSCEIEIPNDKLIKTLKYDKIDEALVEIKRLQDPRYINVITARKIEKTDKKLQKFYFDDKLKLCCPKEKEDSWKEAVDYYSSLIEDESDEEYSDNFEWATDESESISSSDCWDYIVPEIKTTKNIVKDIFF